MENILTIHKTFYKVADFLSWRKNESLVLSPYFQRRSVWDKGAKSYLIDTVYRGLPIPIIFLRDRGVNTKTFEPIREVIDGQQRLRTLISFIAPDLLKDYNADRARMSFFNLSIHSIEKSFVRLLSKIIRHIPDQTDF